MVSEGYDPVILVELQTAVRALEVEVVGRYLSQPANLNKVRLAIAEAFDSLAQLKPAAEVAGGDDCPPGWIHRLSCDCVPASAAASLAGEDGHVKQRREAALEEWRKDST